MESILTMTKVEVEPQQIDSLYVINGLASMAAAVLGIPPLIVHAECIAGVGEGGRTGGTAIFTGIFFLLAIVLQPLLKVSCQYLRPKLSQTNCYPIPLIHYDNLHSGHPNLYHITSFGSDWPDLDA